MRLLTAIALFSTSVLASQNGYGQPSMSSSTTPGVPPAAAQTTPPPVATSGPPPPPGGKQVHTVTVGGEAGLVYNPPSIQAEIGDVVQFMFMKQNHSVTQSSFLKPCNRLPEGLDSGLKPNLNNTVVPPPTWEYVVKEKEPTWWYCRQRNGNHCGKGMVFAINPTPEKSFEKFQQMAIQINGTVTTTAGAPPGVTTTTIATVATDQPLSTITLVPEPTGVSPPPPPPPPSTATNSVAAPYITPGFNNGNGNAACSCACFCGVGSFPQGDGWGSYGGVGGSMKRPW